jgi:low affinity Fe/Cu permease
LTLAVLLQTCQRSDRYALETALNEPLRDAEAQKNEEASRALRVTACS